MSGAIQSEIQPGWADFTCILALPRKASFAFNTVEPEYRYLLTMWKDIPFALWSKAPGHAADMLDGSHAYCGATMKAALRYK
jgi:hypothetical protein